MKEELVSIIKICESLEIMVASDIRIFAVCDLNFG